MKWGTAAYIEGTVATSEAFFLWPAIWVGSCCWTYIWTKLVIKGSFKFFLKNYIYMGSV